MASSKPEQLSLRFWKRCPVCGETLPLTAFGSNRSKKDGLASYCKPCHNQKMREIAERLYGGHRNFLMMKRYGIDVATFENMVEAQGGLCALCRNRHAKHVDHDHATGRVRAILCFKCNNGLGKLQDRPDRVAAAMDYISRTGS